MKAFALAIVVAACSAAWAQVPVARFEVYPLGTAEASAVEPMLRSMAGAEGSVVIDESQHRALVIATDENHARIAEMMEKLAAPPLNVRIDVQFRGASAAHRAGVGISASGEFERDDGLSRSTIRIAPRIENNTVTAASGAQQTLLVGSGRKARLRIGESIPYPDWFVDYGLSRGYLRERVSWRDVGSSLVVEPVVIGEGPMIRIRLTPELSGLVDGNPLHVAFASVATEVVATDGQTFQIGGLEQDREFYSRFLFGGSHESGSAAMSLFLTPHILPPGR